MDPISSRGRRPCEAIESAHKWSYHTSLLQLKIPLLMCKKQVQVNATSTSRTSRSNWLHSCCYYVVSYLPLGNIEPLGCHPKKV